ncbi:MAG TPA: KTSC domain-containing protein [Thermoanaerobaculia bacterium]|nr:KTSC domain-containing protein [Thermoanaerobaculia bacterium]
MRRRLVSSSAISSVGYDRKEKTLELEFSSGGVYDYYEVPPKVYAALMSAESKGRFVSERIRGQYRSERV